jgi:hypothetical protein
MNEEGYMIIAEGEDMTVEEAKLSYAERSRLPSTAFCGPDRSFPAHDAAHVRNGLARLKRSKFSPAVKAKILACLRRRAKKYSVEVSETEHLVEDTPAQLDAKIKWLYSQYNIK